MRELSGGGRTGERVKKAQRTLLDCRGGRVKRESKEGRISVKLRRG